MFTLPICRATTFIWTLFLSAQRSTSCWLPSRPRGMTVIENAAKEPHIVDLANFLNSMGRTSAEPAPTSSKSAASSVCPAPPIPLFPTRLRPAPHGGCSGHLRGRRRRNVIPKHLESISAKLEEMGVTVIEEDEAVRVSRTGRLNKCNIKTMPHPGFPTDMRPQSPCCFPSPTVREHHQ